MFVSRLRVAAAARQLSKRAAATPFSTTARQLEAAPPTPPPASTTSTTQVTEGPAPAAVVQAPNRAEVWSTSQRPRPAAMTGPRFEQTDFELQVRACLSTTLQSPPRTHAPTLARVGVDDGMFVADLPGIRDSPGRTPPSSSSTSSPCGGRTTGWSRATEGAGPRDTPRSLSTRTSPRLRRAGTAGCLL
jgi:NADH dehydrogenase (ubiquinone) Fe-S protein 6